MLNNLKKVVFLIFLSSVFAYAETELDAVNADQRFIYIGVDGGVAEPVIKNFKHEHSGSEFVLKRAETFGVRVGYSFYPQIAIGLSAAHSPKYRLHYTLPVQTLPSGAIIPQTPGSTKVVSNVFMLNMTYDLAKVQGITPFVVVAVGLAQVEVKPTSSKWELINSDYFRIKKTKNNCFAWQMGLGLAKELTSNFSVNITARLQSVYDIKIKYETLDIATQSFARAMPIKKTIGVGEFAIGLTYKLPM